jgi:hypothetical protein
LRAENESPGTARIRLLAVRRFASWLVAGGEIGTDLFPGIKARRVEPRGVNRSEAKPTGMAVVLGVGPIGLAQRRGGVCLAVRLCVRKVPGVVWFWRRNQDEKLEASSKPSCSAIPATDASP